MPTSKNYPAYIISRIVYIPYVTLHFRDRRDLASLPLLIDIVILAGANFLGKERIQRNDILLRAE